MISQGKEYHCVNRVSVRGWINDDIPMMSARLRTFAPTIFPIAKSGTPFRAAVSPVTSSGSEVPMAIMESPMITDGMPMAVAIETPEDTRKRLPRMTIAIPTRNRMADFLKFFGVSEF